LLVPLEPIDLPSDNLADEVGTPAFTDQGVDALRQSFRQPQVRGLHTESGTTGHFSSLHHKKRYRYSFAKQEQGPRNCRPDVARRKDGGYSRMKA
jgi:hypothetical protein